MVEAANNLEDACHAAAEQGRPLPGLGSASNHPSMVPSAPSAAQALQQGPQGQPIYEEHGRQPMFGHEPMPTYGQPPMYGQQPPYDQAPIYGQQPTYGQQPMYGEQSMYGQQPMCGQQPMHGPTLLQSGGPRQGGMGDGAKVAMAAAGGLALGAGGMYLAEHFDDIRENFDDALDFF